MAGHTKGCAAFVATVAAGCFIAWAGGFDFDHRDIIVGFSVLCVLVAGIGAYALFADGEGA